MKIIDMSCMCNEYGFVLKDIQNTKIVLMNIDTEEFIKIPIYNKEFTLPVFRYALEAYRRLFDTKPILT